MQPDPLRRAQLGELRQGVDDPAVRGPRRGHHGHRGQRLRLEVGDNAPQGGHGQHPAVVHGHGDHAVVVQPEHVRGSDHGEVALRAGQDPQRRRPHRSRGRSRNERGAFQALVAGQHEGLQVGGGAARGEHAVGALGEADAPGGPREQLPLHDGGGLGLVPRVQGHVDRGGQRLGGHGGHGHRAVEVGEGARVVEPHRVAQPRAVQLVHGGVEVRQGRVEVHVRELRGDLGVGRRLVGLLGRGHARGAGGRGRGDVPHEVRDGVLVQQG